MKRAPVVLGLDLSLGAPAACVLSSMWKPGYWLLKSACWKSEIDEFMKARLDNGWPIERARIERLDFIAKRVAQFARLNNATSMNNAAIFVEGYAFGSQNAREALAELGGVVKLFLLKDLGIVVRPIVAASARKTLLGKVPSKKTSGVEVKDYVNEKLARMGARFKTMDEGDAFVIANAGRAALGLSHIGVNE